MIDKNKPLTDREVIHALREHLELKGNIGNNIHINSTRDGIDGIFYADVRRQEVVNGIPEEAGCRQLFKITVEIL